ncbi:MAG: ComEA family DNA-binding protein [Firmicutes bacterium]|nr:ComEA family DNA-binding protein [Bacillota bacterium]
MFQIGRKEQVVLLIIIAALLFGSGYRLAQHKMENKAQKPMLVTGEEKTEEATKPTIPQKLVIHVSGAVKSPGVYKLNQDSRVVDAVKMAGGAEENANLDRLNLAAPLTDGQKVHVLEINTVVEGDSSFVPIDAAVPGKMNINSANEAELSTLPGIGPALSKRIIEYRTNYGSFKAIEEIKSVSGIGDKKYDDIKSLISTY